MTNHVRPPASPAASPTAELAIRPLTTKEFTLFKAFIYREAGIYLNDTKQQLLAARLQRRLRALGLSSFGAYYRRVVDGDDEERV